MVVTPGRDTQRLPEATHKLTRACFQRAQGSWFNRRESKPEDTLDFAHTDVVNPVFPVSPGLSKDVTAGVTAAPLHL